MAEELSSPVIPAETGRAGSEALAPQSHHDVGEYQGAPSAIHQSVFDGFAVVEAGLVPLPVPVLVVVAAAEVGPTEAEPCELPGDPVVVPELVAGEEVMEGLVD